MAIHTLIPLVNLFKPWLIGKTENNHRKDLIAPKTYSVAPNVDASRWIIKLEDVAPTESFSSKDEAILAAEKLAKENSPSKIQILDENHKVIDEKED